ncbi:ferredoxin [Velocimicrobium porci]|uniref:Ferredoxin n=1 Tax=Velocimicrobium porci TaxID=2606634 RepID=A0A6L5XY05_9FIRM|nr:ferredoxin [Velocimicrobium porci]MSS63407.1 ferredoxin [Velocimicrobium porci]
MKAYVNQEDCISCGLCVSVCPDVFQFNDDDKSEAIKEEIPEDVVESAIEARDGCPVSVIDIEE